MTLSCIFVKRTWEIMSPPPFPRALSPCNTHTHTHFFRSPLAEPFGLMWHTSVFGVNLFPLDDDTHILTIIIVVINVRKFTSLARHHETVSYYIHNIVITYKGRFSNGRFSHTAMYICMNTYKVIAMLWSCFTPKTVFQSSRRRQECAEYYV